MPEFRAEVNHSLGRDQAVTRLKGFVQDVRDKFHGQLDAADGNWVDNVLDFTLKAAGLTITGQLTVDEAAARVNGRLPLIATPMRGMIERQIAEQLEAALS